MAVSGKKRAYEGSLERAAKKIKLPALNYAPRNPRKYNPAIGLIGCGGITEMHLAAYKSAGYRIVALCDKDESRAKERRDRFYPEAQIYSEYLDLLERSDIKVVDIATHPKDRVPILAAALSMKKHVLSQKPFVLDVNEGVRLCDLADQQGVRLAVNQNGRWAPHFAYIRQAIQAGIVGDIYSIQCSINWDHNWISGTPFDSIKHVILYDFAIHWFDLVDCFMKGQSPLRVNASVSHTIKQTAKPALLAQVAIEYEHAQATLIFNGDTQFGQSDTTVVTGSKATISSSGPNLSTQEMTVITKDGIAKPKLKGTWFKAGFRGTMGELLCAIEERREPENGARANLRSLELCFASVLSADTQLPVVPGVVTKLPYEQI